MNYIEFTGECDLLKSESPKFTTQQIAKPANPNAQWVLVQYLKFTVKEAIPSKKNMQKTMLIKQI